MGKKIFYGVGGILILFLIGVWVYLLVYGTPTSVDDVFTDLGFSSTQEIDPDFTTPTPEPPAPSPTVDVASAALRQLTTRRVAGFQSVDTGADAFVYYAEKGTGHIYRINLENGQEERISATTIPQAHDAHFSPTADIVVMRSRFESDGQVVIGRLDSEEKQLSLSTLDEIIDDAVFDITISQTNELLFTTKNTDTTTGYALNLNNFSIRSIFTIPLPEAAIEWGSGGTATHFAHTLPSALLTGYLYQITPTLRPLKVVGNGLVAFAHGPWITSSFYDASGRYSSFTTNRNTQQTVTNAIVALPEKCTYKESVPAELYCGYDFNLVDTNLPDSWYQGSNLTSDSLWQVDPISSQATLLVDIVAETGRNVDIDGIAVAESLNILFFKNRRDDSLWAYDL